MESDRKTVFENEEVPIVFMTNTLSENEMNTTKLTKHSSERMQQRAIPPLIVDWLMAYGATEYDHHGAEIHYFDKKARRQLERDFGGLIVRRLDDLLDTYLVVGTDGGVITVGHREQRINRH